MKKTVCLTAVHPVQAAEIEVLRGEEEETDGNAHPQYQKQIEKRHKVMDGYCYLGYLWDYIYYIADLYFFHAAMNQRMDKRGFSSVEGMKLFYTTGLLQWAGK